MSANFALFDVKTNEQADLITVDNEVCDFLGIDCNPDQYDRWYQCIGFLCAMQHQLHSKSIEVQLGMWFRPLVTKKHKDYQKHLEKSLENRSEMFRVLRFLRTKYRSDGWRTIGR